MRIVVRWLRVLAVRLGRALVAVGAGGDGSPLPAGATTAGPGATPSLAAGPGAAPRGPSDTAGTGPPAHWLAAIAAHDPALADPADPRWQGTAAPDRREPPPVVAPRQSRPAPPPTQPRPRARPRRRATRTRTPRRTVAADDPDPSPTDSDTPPHEGPLRRVAGAARAAGRAAAWAWRAPTRDGTSPTATEADRTTDRSPRPPTHPDLSTPGDAVARGSDGDATSPEPPARRARPSRVGDVGPRWSSSTDTAGDRRHGPAVTWEDQPAASHPLPTWPALPDEHDSSTASGADDGWSASPVRDREAATPAATGPATLGPWPGLPARPGAVRLPDHQLTDRWRHEQERR